MKTILVTGGAGFIGSNLMFELLKTNNHRIICFDNFDDFYSRDLKKLNISPFLENPNFSLIQGDIRNVEDLLKVGPVDVIVHLAAKAGVRPSIENPVLYQEVNVTGTQYLLEYARKTGVKQFVFASSSSVYGVNPDMPWNEEQRLVPISPYASTKLSGEMLGHVYSHLYGIRFLALRFFTVYGPGQRPDLAIHKFFRAILNDVSIPVYGDGSTSRDYTFVKDTVAGIMSAIEYDSSMFEIFNLGNNQTVTLIELIEAIESSVGKKAKIDWLPEQPGDVPRTYANIEKARDLLDYSPKTNLKIGLDSFKNWFLDNLIKD